MPEQLLLSMEGFLQTRIIDGSVGMRTVWSAILQARQHPQRTGILLKGETSEGMLLHVCCRCESDLLLSSSWHPNSPSLPCSALQLPGSLLTRDLPVQAVIRDGKDVDRPRPHDSVELDVLRPSSVIDCSPLEVEFVVAKAPPDVLGIGCTLPDGLRGRGLRFRSLRVLSMARCLHPAPSQGYTLFATRQARAGHCSPCPDRTCFHLSAFDLVSPN